MVIDDIGGLQQTDVVVRSHSHGECLKSVIDPKKEQRGEIEAIFFITNAALFRCLEIVCNPAMPSMR